jgi:hypothetical protein
MARHLTEIVCDYTLDSSGSGLALGIVSCKNRNELLGFKVNFMCGRTLVHGICYKQKDVNGTTGNVSTNNLKHLFLSHGVSHRSCWKSPGGYRLLNTDLIPISHSLRFHFHS